MLPGPRAVRGVEQLKPIIRAVRRVGHPLVEAERGGIAEDCRARVVAAPGVAALKNRHWPPLRLMDGLSTCGPYSTKFTTCPFVLNR